MDLVNNNLSPLPFYQAQGLNDGTAWWDSRKDYAYGSVYPLICPLDYLIPFQIQLPDDFGNLQQIQLITADRSRTVTITQQMAKAGLELLTENGHKILRFPAKYPLFLNQAVGQYFLRIAYLQVGTPGTRKALWSDVFTMVNNPDCYLRIDYSNSYPLVAGGTGVYFGGDNNFKFSVWLDTQIGKPEYVFEEESTERMGYSFIESQVSKKRFNFAFVAPEYLCDAMRIIRMCDNVSIYSKGRTYDAIKFELDISWEEQGNLASVTATFDTDTVLVNLGGYRETSAPVIEPTDYNNDYNLDFDAPVDFGSDGYLLDPADYSGAAFASGYNSVISPSVVTVKYLDPGTDIDVEGVS